MAPKNQQDQALARRRPQQARALFKVELILEASMRLLDRDEVQALTTNAVAQEAGVSIGTLYQYFHDKEAILQALMQRELGELAARAMKSLTGPPPDTAGERVRLVMRAVLSAYGGRSQVHRRLFAHAVAGGGGGRLNPLFEGVAGFMSSQGVVASDKTVRQMTPAEAFVLTRAVVGVMHGLVGTHALPARQQDIEDALVRLVVAFVHATG